MKSVVKILLYDPNPIPVQKKQVVLKDPGLSEGLVPSSVSATTGWVGVSGWTVASPGVASFDGNDTLGVLTQPFSTQLDDSVYYDVQFSLDNVTQGGVEVYMGNERIGVFSADGTYNTYWKRTGSTEVGQITFKPVELSGNKFIGDVVTNDLRILQYKEYSKLQNQKVKRYYPKDYLDTKEDISLAYNFQLTDISNLNTSRGGFVKQFTLPGTKKNRELLGYFGENDSSYYKIDVRNKFRADIIIDDNTFLEGWLVLKSVSVDQHEIDFDCEFYDSVFGLFDAIKGLKVSDIDVSLYDHLLTDDAIFDTWDPSRTWEQVYTYPLFHLDGTEDIYRTKDFSPSFYNKYLFAKIILDTGIYGYSVSDEADETLEKLITTPIGKRRTIDSNTEGESIFVGLLTDQNFTTPVNTTADFLRLTNLRIAFTDDFQNGHYDPYDVWDTSQLTYTVNQIDVAHTFEFYIDTNIISTPSSFGFDNNDPQGLITGTFIDPNNYDPNLSQVEVYIDDPNGVRIAQSLVYPFSQFASTATTTVPFIFSGSVTLQSPLAGQYIMRLRILDNLMWFIGESFGSIDNNFSYSRTVTVNSSNSYYRVTPELGTEISDNTIVRLNKWLPNVDQTHFINEHMNLFNLYAFEGIDKKINFITRTELYSDPYPINWSKKIEFVEDVKPLTDITSTRTILGYKETSDEWNDQYKADNQEIQYGDYIFNNKTDLFNEDAEERSKIYGSTPMVTDQGGRIVPAIHTSELPKEHRLLLQGDNTYLTSSKIWMNYFDPYAVADWIFDDNFVHHENLGLGYLNDDYVAFTSSSPHGLSVGDKIRIEQDSSVIGDNPLYNGLCEVLKVIDSNKIVVNRPYNIYSSHPVPGEAFILSNRDYYRPDLHIDSITGSTIDINWGPIPFTLLPFNLGISPNNLGEKYYRDQLIQNRDGKLYTCQANLSLLDVKEIIAHVGAKIWIDELNAYFTLYSIQDFDPVVHSLTKVELLEVVSNTTFRRISSGGNTTIGGGVGGNGLISGVGGVLDTLKVGTNGSTVFVTQYGNTVRGGSTIVIGTGNQTYNNTNKIIVMGDNNNINQGVNNTFVLGNNVNATESNAFYISNYALFTQNRTTLYNKTIFNSSGMSIDNMFFGQSGITIGGSGLTIYNTGITVGGLSGVIISSSSITINGVTITSGITELQNLDQTLRKGDTAIGQNINLNTVKISGTVFSGGSIRAGYQHSIDSTSYFSSIIAGSANTLTSAVSSAIIGGDGNETKNGALRSVIIGGINNEIGTLDGAVVIGASGITANNHYTAFMNNAHIEHLLTLKPISTLPIASEGRIFYSAGTGIYYASGNTISDWVLLQGGSSVFSSTTIAPYQLSYPYYETGTDYSINYLTDSIIGCQSKATSITILLPKSNSIPNMYFVVKDVSEFAGTNFITVSAQTSDTIYDFSTASTQTLITTNGGSLTLQNTGTGKWLVI